VTEHHAAFVYRYALALTGAPSDAEDVTETTLAEEYWAAQGRPAPNSRRKRLIDIAHEVCSRRFDFGGDVDLGETACPDPELALTRRADGRLSLRQRRMLATHLRLCRDCAALADELAAQRAALRELAAIPVPASLGRRENPGASLRPGRHLNQ
jgi:DNA-directed RNA polymerase specialized sigma24 family protein